jgi:hypothetical protein
MSESCYIKKGKTFHVSSKESLNLHEKLPAVNFTVQITPDGAYVLEEIDLFTDITRHYGDNLKNAKRIFSTFLAREQSTGVMLTGKKGSGKSLLAKTLSLEGYKHDIPTIVINAPHRGDTFNKFIQAINQPTIILFDEFEKVYNDEEQQEILTLLDGVYPSKKLFILTCNNKWRVDSNMRNRPGRIFYLLDYSGLDQTFIREYCELNLNNKQFIDKTCTIISIFSEFNFDMLKALVEEMNRYNEDPLSSLRMLNIKPEYEDVSSFDMTLHTGKTELNLTEGRTWSGNPLAEEIEVAYRMREGEDRSYHNQIFNNSHIVEINAATGIYRFQDGNLVLTLTKRVQPQFNIPAF